MTGDTKPYLPRPYTGERRIERARDDYRERQWRHHEAFPDYEKAWARPSKTTVEAIGALLGVDVTPALVVALDAAIQAGEDGRMLTTNLVFDELAARWSDHYRQAREQGPARVSWEMSPAVLKASWHDLLLNDIRLEDIMPAVKDGCGLYTTERCEGRGWTVDLTDETQALREQFTTCIKNDALTGGAYRRRGSAKRLLLANDLDDRDDATATRKVVAGWAYNVAEPGAKSLEVIRRLESTRLYLDAEAVMAEAVRLADQSIEIQAKLRDTYGADVTKSNRRPNVEWLITDPKTGQPRKGRVPSARGRELRKKVRRQDAKAVAALVRQYDRLDGQYNQLKPISDRLAEMNQPGELEIRSRFAKLSNRRYQALDFWPTEISGKKSSMQSEGVAEYEGHEILRTTTRRGRFFQIGASRSAEERAEWTRNIEHAAGVAFLPYRAFLELEDQQDLIGVDVSASQLQILAVFLGSTKLEAQLSERSYKTIAAERVWERHENALDPLTLPAGFEGERDDRLQASLKTATMTSLYDSMPREIVKTLAESVEDYGPGLGNAENIKMILADEALNLGDIERWFKPLCRLVAKNAMHADPYAGAVFTDPYDGAAVRWNPVAWDLQACAGASETRIYAKTPRAARHTMTPSKTGRLHPQHGWEPAEPNAAGDYPVYHDKLRRMIGPCLTHMLDAAFASCVIEELARRGVQVVSIHDSWIVPKDAAEDLEQAVKAAGEPWLRSLGVVYDDLLRYLPCGKYAKWVRERKALWEARVARCDWPAFKTGPASLVDLGS